jgi:hypothetical protein
MSNYKKNGLDTSIFGSKESTAIPSVITAAPSAPFSSVFNNVL